MEGFKLSGTFRIDKSAICAEFIVTVPVLFAVIGSFAYTTEAVFVIAPVVFTVAVNIMVACWPFGISPTVQTPVPAA